MKEFYRRYFSGLLAFYIALRALSFFLKDSSASLEIIAALLIGAFIYSCVKNISLAWKLLVIELLLDGAGHFFELRSLLLRTWFLGIFACAWITHKLKARSKIIFPQKNISIALAIFGAFFFWAIINGLMHKNSVTFVLQDAMLYLFVTLLFPALEFEHDNQMINALATKIFIFGTTIFSAITFALYSSRLFFLTDPYYHWFRDIAAGKITDLGLNFFRIVLPEV
ncbi:MAG: hypothetical protein NT003_00820 [Candidatus Magasanikbacteria bacterium]|nr:hypothetical protein [Candidatus Magasanikbacteria bacterium]